MAERESTQNELLRNTEEMVTYRLSSYSSTARAKEWSIGIGAYYDLEGRLRRLERTVFREMPRAMQYIMMRELERYGLKDTIPPAASAEYEWHSEVMRTKETVTNMLNTFDELETRLSYHVKLIEHSDELLELARAMGNRYLREAVLTLHDALCGTYSEDLTTEQVKAIEHIVSRLQEIKWDRQAVRALDRTLRQQGFETVPSDRFMRSGRERSEVD